MNADRMWHCTADPATVPCGLCAPCRQDHADAYLEGRADEREACVQFLDRRGRPTAANLIRARDLLDGAS